MLAPVFEEGGNLIKKEFPNPGVVTFAKVDCDNQRKWQSLAATFTSFSVHCIALCRYQKSKMTQKS